MRTLNYSFFKKQIIIYRHVVLSTISSQRTTTQQQTVNAEMEQYLAGLKNLYVFFKNSVTVFLDEAFNLVFDMVSEVMNDKSGCRHSRFLKMHIFPVFAVQLLTPVLIRSIWHLTNQRKKTAKHNHTLLVNWITRIS